MDPNMKLEIGKYILYLEVDQAEDSKEEDKAYMITCKGKSDITLTKDADYNSDESRVELMKDMMAGMVQLKKSGSSFAGLESEEHKDNDKVVTHTFMSNFGYIL